MNEHGADHYHPLRGQSSKEPDVDSMLETRITHVLHQQAAHMHFTPVLREKIMHRISPRPKHVFAFTPASIFAMSFLVILSLATYLFYPLIIPLSSQVSLVHYRVATTLSTPVPLANGGELVSLDPTQQHFVYQNLKEPGVMYTANLSDPSASNVLAMRDARGAAWSPDGSALVTTIYPAGVTTPLLALVHTGQYMNTLGHTALAASWSPTSKQEIVFVTQQNNRAQLWSTTPQPGQTPTLLANIQLPASSLVQRLLWSPDGRRLAVIITQGDKPSPQVFDQAGTALLLMDMQSKNIHALSLVKGITLGNVQWAPNGHFLTYEQVSGQNHIILQTIDITTQHIAFTLVSHHTLLGWSWSPYSNALVYSDGGTLLVHVLYGSQAVFTHTNAEYPLWLHDGRILALAKMNSVGKLEIFAQTH